MEMKRKTKFLYIRDAVTWAILHSGDIGANSSPFGQSSDEEAYFEENINNALGGDAILAELWTPGELINDGVEVVELLGNRAYGNEMELAESDPARGSNEPPPTHHGPKRATFSQIYTLFGKSCLDFAGPFHNYVTPYTRALLPRSYRIRVTDP